MKHFAILLFAVLAFSQDPRTYNHGTCFFEYEQNDSTKYYATWSSDVQYGWEHNIYSSVFHLSESGSLHVEIEDHLFIGSTFDEAQEPVHADIDNSTNTILSVWEDGSDSDAPNVRGQLHTPDGVVIKENWIIAGGVGSQHSANTSHLSNSFIIFYADEAAPATKGAVVKGKVINDETGEEQQTLVFSPYDEDHWWPVSVSNDSNSKTLILWGNDGYATMGTILYDSLGTIAMVHAPKDYLVNTQQYFYQIEWLEAVKQFLLIARHGAYENLTDSSKIALIDTTGNVTQTWKVPGGIIREAKMAKRWNSCDSSYTILFPTGENVLSQLTISNMEVPFELSTTTHSSNQSWVSTGTWGHFLKDVSGNAVINGKNFSLFIQNDENSNDLIKTLVSFDSKDCADNQALDPQAGKQIPKLHVLYTGNHIAVPLHLQNMHYEIYSIHGKHIQSGIVTSQNIPVNKAKQVLLFRVNDHETQYQETVKILKN